MRAGSRRKGPIHESARAAAVLSDGATSMSVRLEDVDDGIAHVRVHVVDRAAREEGDAELEVHHLDDLGILAAQRTRAKGRGRAVRIPCPA